MFEGFETLEVELPEVRLHARTGGQGPALLLVHGYPQTHVMWHRIAPALARHFTLVIPDLRGYGDSGKPPSDAAHLAYSKRRMGQDLFALMSHLGHARFCVAGHDRGGRVAYRMALDDTARRIVRIATLDIVPTLDMWALWDAERALGSFHWDFLAQPAPLPERLIGAEPLLWWSTLVNRWAAAQDFMDPAARQAYERAFADPAVIHASCEDYRAGAGIDRQLDAADLGRRFIEAPLLALWGQKGRAAVDQLTVWRRWARDVRGCGLDCGHFLAEELPHETTRLLLEFFAADH